MTTHWVDLATRDAVVAFVQQWQPKVAWSLTQMLKTIDLNRSKYYQWVARVGQANQHNAPIPCRHWLTPAEQTAILAYQAAHPDEGYRRLSYQMLDAGMVATSPSTVYRLLKSAGRLRQWPVSESKKGKGFQQPTRPHAHWHTDVTYLNICGTFYYLCSLLDGFSRAIVHWEIRESMQEKDIEIIIQRALEAYPEARPRLISDNGSQFVARDFKAFVREVGMQHVRTSPYYPQSNGKIERWHKTLKTEAIRPKTPLTVEQARVVVDTFVTYYNQERLHSAIGYITPMDKMAGKAASIFAKRKEELQAARLKRGDYWIQERALLKTSCP